MQTGRTGAVLNIYARTFMIATMTDAWKADRERPRRRDASGWLAVALRRLSGRAD